VDEKTRHREEEWKLPRVRIREEETFESALRRFKRKCQKAGIISEIKKRQHYEKPSVKKKRKALAARKKLLKRMMNEKRYMQ
jgi:small subunit ribosomal protein S21